MVTPVNDGIVLEIALLKALLWKFLRRLSRVKTQNLNLGDWIRQGGHMVAVPFLEGLIAENLSYNSCVVKDCGGVGAH